MPSKEHRAASRQAQAQQRGKKRRSSKGRPQVFDPGPSQSGAAVAVRESDVEAAAQPQGGARAAAGASAPMRRIRQRVSADPLEYRFLGSELRKIAVVMTFMVIILGVLTFFLR